jgi:hypothetical protein
MTELPAGAPDRDAILRMVRAEIARPTHASAPPTGHLARAGELQRSFRREPLGGRLLSLKKVLYWFSASAFDRQAKAVEELLAAVEELSDEVDRLRREVAAFDPGSGDGR